MQHRLTQQLLAVTTQPARNIRRTKTSYSLQQPSTPSPTSDASTIKSYIRQLPAHEQWVLGHIQSIPATDLILLLQAIKSGDTAIGSDGSVKQQQASYSARIQATTNSNAFASLHSLGEHMSSTRAETLGYLAALYLLRLLIRFHKVLFRGDPTDINVYIDNQGVLKRLSPYGADYSIGHTLATNSDLMREICNVEATLPFTFNQQHVKSHQFDNEHDSAQIPLPNLLNKQCDLIAEVAYTCSTCTNPAPCPPFPTTTAYL